MKVRVHPGRWRRRQAALGACLLAAGCAVQDPPPAQELQAQALPALQLPQAWASPVPDGDALAGSWLGSFGDAQLEAFVARALAHNPDLKVAAARVAQAEAAAQAAGATLLPEVTAMGRGGGALSGDSSGLQGFGVFANWELDLWGRVRSGRAAASAQYESAALENAFARQSLAATAAKHWFLAVEAAGQASIAADMVQAAERLASLAGDRHRVGRGDELELRQAQANLQAMRDTLAQLELAGQQALRALELLAGQYPGAALPISDALPAMPGPVPVGLPSELLERRPDVIAAERRVAAAYYRSGEARAARLPRIALTAGGTSISSDLFVLQDRDNPVWSAGANLSAPIYLGGALQAQVAVRDAEQEAAIAEYGRVGAGAFGEVESALSTGFTLDRRHGLLEQAVADNARALELAEIRFRVGSVDLRVVQQQQLALQSARSALLRVQTERLVQRVNLHLALGGDWTAVPPDANAS